ncbi:spore germination protein D [Virgibacillus halotolerans]|uniref:spore germination lipoprotein GerD n=1 Tax=Virgibacillus halotolerans TaxID=1071053 RepID=UPI00196163FE|nr:spore germination lipoprotein GerD [Virgibacillus halotolerans]MBM7601838.1 spore germination protein D [Virgibacillus halotolerans]
MIRNIFILIAGISIIMMSACDGGDSSAKEGEYDTTKKMVVDILQTDDGRRALAEIMTDDKMKQELVINSDVVKQSINDALTSEKGAEMWTKLFKDPKFVESYVKSMSDEQKKLMKNLMNDAEFQKQMLELLQNPEITEQMLQVLKGQQFRAHLETAIQQTIDTPLFQAKIQDILLKAADEENKNESAKDEEGGEKTEQDKNDENDKSSDAGGAG